MISKIHTYILPVYHLLRNTNINLYICMYIFKTPKFCNKTKTILLFSAAQKTKYTIFENVVKLHYKQIGGAFVPVYHIFIFVKYREFFKKIVFNILL